MDRPEKERKPGVEGWIDEQIRLAISGWAHPFEKRILRLQRRIQRLHARIHRLAGQIDEDSKRAGEPKKRSSGEETP